MLELGAERASVAQAKALTLHVLITPELPQERRPRGRAPKAHVHQEVPSSHRDAGDLMGPRPNPVLGVALVVHPPEERGDAIALRLEHAEEQAVELKAVPAPLLADELGLERAEVEAHRPPEEDIEVLKGDGQGLGPVELLQAVDRGRGERA